MSRYIKTRKRDTVPKRHIMLAVQGRNVGTVVHSEILDIAAVQVMDWTGTHLEPAGHCTVTDPAELWERLVKWCRKDHRAILWCHGAAYAMILCRLARAIESDLFSVRTIIDKDPPFAISGLVAGRRLDIWDLRNWYHDDLAAIARSLREDWLAEQWEAWHKNHNSDRTCSEVMIIASAVAEILGFVTLRGLGSLRPTIAGQAMQWYRRKTGLIVGDKVRTYEQTWAPCDDYKPRRLPLIHMDDEIRDYERCAYYGGIIRGWHYGHEFRDVYHLDVRGMYPAVYRDTLLPAQFAGMQWFPSVEDVTEKLDSYVCIARCRVNSRNLPYPVKINDTLGYCRGRFWTWLPHSELCRAIWEGCVEDVRLLLYYKGEYLLRKHADLALTYRNWADEDGNKFLSGLCKMLGNTIWSKWAQRGERWEKVDYPDAPHRWGKWGECNAQSNDRSVYRAMGRSVWKRDGTRHSPDSMPSISACVSSGCREFMLYLYGQCPDKSLLYTAVDSLHVTADGYRQLMEASSNLAGEYGNLQLKERYDKVVYHAPGWYTHDGVEVRAGLPETAVSADGISFNLYQRASVEDLCNSGADGVATLHHMSYTSPIGRMEANGDGKAVTRWGEHFDHEGDRYL